MAFFRKWKTHYKHKKFTSDDVVDADDWKLTKKSVKEVKNNDDLKLNIEQFEEGGDKPIFQSYDIKYLGCTPIITKRSEKITSEAIKTVIANAKAGGRKIKSQKRVKLNVSQDGLEILDHITKEMLMRFSIYKISYCSVDASHDHAFSFVGSEPDPLSDMEKMSCHVFLCPKRKIAHEITLLVARCFESAYQNWRDNVMPQSDKVPSQNGILPIDNDQALKELNGVIESKAEVHYPPRHQMEQNSIIDNPLPLIDLAVDDNNCVRKYLQNTWVSFDDEVQQQKEGFPITAY